VCLVDLEVSVGGAISPLRSVNNVGSAHWTGALTVEPRRHTVLTEYVLHTRAHTHTHAHTGFCTVARTHTNTHTSSEDLKKSPRKKKRPRTFGPGHENVPPREVSQTHTDTVRDTQFYLATSSVAAAAPTANSIISNAKLIRD